MEDPWLQLKAEATIQILQPLLEKVLSVPATSAPVERVFSQSGLIMRPNRARKQSSSSLCFSNVIATCDCGLLVLEVQTEAKFCAQLVLR